MDVVKWTHQARLADDGGAGDGLDGTARIGIDFDGVLFDQVPHIIQGFRQIHGVDISPVESWHWDLSRHEAVVQADLSEDDIWEVFRRLEVKHEIHRTGPLDTHALEVLETLVDQGHAVHIATSRPERAREAVELFLEHNGVAHHELEMGVWPKTGYDVLIDDLPPNVEAAAEDGGLGLLFDQPYNAGFGCDGNPRRVKGWSHVAQVLGL